MQGSNDVICEIAIKLSCQRARSITLHYITVCIDLAIVSMLIELTDLALREREGGGGTTIDQLQILTSFRRKKLTYQCDFPDQRKSIF